MIIHPEAHVDRIHEEIIEGCLAAVRAVFDDPDAVVNRRRGEGATEIVHVHVSGPRSGVHVAFSVSRPDFPTRPRPPVVRE